MRLTILLFFLFASCKSNHPSLGNGRYGRLNNLWQTKASRAEVIFALGAEYQEVQNGITYSFPEFNYPQSGHIFNKSNQLVIQFIFLEEKEFEKFKTEVKCPWDVVRKKDSSGHSIKTIEYGSCKSLNITYAYPSNLNTYEIRWEK